MAVLTESIGLNRDIPLGPSLLFALAAAGSATDYEHVLAVVPDLTKLAGTGQAGTLPRNALQLRIIAWTTEATLTGANTNNFTWKVFQKRAGALLINTTTPTAVAAPGAVTITPAAMTNIVLGTRLDVDSAGTPETITVTAVTATTFTATFASTHSSTWDITSAPLASRTYASGTNETALVPRQIAALAGNVLLPGDILTFKRVSSNATGLASPAVTVQVDWAPVQGKQAVG